MPRPQLMRTRLSATLLLCLGLLAGCEKSATDDLAKAKLSIEANQPAAAVISLKNALVKDPKLAEARLLLGEQLQATGDIQGAVAELRKAMDLKLPMSQVGPPLASAMLAAGQAKPLIALLQPLTFTDPAVTAQVQTSLALAHLSMGDLAAANKAVGKATAADPKSVRARLARARIALVSGDDAGALQQAEVLLIESPKDDSILTFKGEVLERSPTRQDDAMAVYAKAVEINPKNYRALSSLVGLQLIGNDLQKAKQTMVAMRALAPKAFFTLYYDGRLKHLSGDYAAARTQFQTVLNLAPENTVALLASGVNEMKLNAWIQAEAQLNRAVNLAPSNMAARYYLAQTQLRLGRPEQATAALAPLLAGESPAPEVLLTAAQARLLQGDPKGADALFTRAAQLHAQDPNVRVAMALVHAGKGDTETAVRELQMIADTSDGTEADLRLISARVARNELEAALQAIEVLARKQPANPAAQELRGQVLLKKKDVAGARSAFEAALRQNPHYLPAIANLAELDLIENKPEQAKKRLTDLAEREPGNANVQIALATYATRTGGTQAEIIGRLEKATIADPRDARARLLLIERHFVSGNARAALEAAQSAVAAIPDNAVLLDALARCQMRLGDSSQALLTYGKLQRVAPKEPAGYIGQATVLFGLNDLEGATRSLQQLLAIQPRTIEAKRLLIGVAMKGKQVDKALALSRDLQREYPEQSFGWAMEGEVQMDQARWPAAAAAFRTGLSKQRPEPLAPRLHTVLVKDGKTAEAEKLVLTWTRDKPQDTAFLGYLADSAFQAGNTTEAARRYEQILAIEPKNPGALNNMAWLMLQNKQAGAVAMAERAAAEAPDQPDVLDTLAQAYAADKQYAKAIDALKRGINRAVNPAPLRLSLAKVYLQADEPANAVAELERLRDLGKDFPQQGEVRRLLAAQRKG